MIIFEWTFPARGTWIEMWNCRRRCRRGGVTFPARGTWIEIQWPPGSGKGRSDVPRKGNVDRNPEYRDVADQQPHDVPRKGNVDRNDTIRGGFAQILSTFPARGTWIEIPIYTTATRGGCWTFPARGTWIEIPAITIRRLRRTDVPRKGNVDRNSTADAVSGLYSPDVPRKGNVDRNVRRAGGARLGSRRSPQGERG